MIPLKYYSIRFRRKKQHVNPDEGILPYLEYLIGDAAYDSIKAMKEAIGVALIPAIKLNRRRGKPRGRRAKIGKFPKTEEGQIAS